MQPAVYAILAFIVVMGVTTLAGLALAALLRDPVSQRLRRVEAEGTGVAAVESIFRWEEAGKAAAGWWRRLLERWGALLLGRSAPAQESRRLAVRRRLTMAGYDNPRSVLIFLGAKLALGGGFAYSYFLYGLLVKRLPPQLFLVSAILGVIGFVLPDFWLSQRIRERQRLIRNALPDLLDLLVVCVEAGLALDGALARITERTLGKVTPLHDELRRVHLEFRAGRPRAEALRALADRTGVEEVRTIVGAFVQTEKLGTSLANTLRVHAEAARVQRRHRAEKAAYMAPLKMLFPIVMFLFPAIFLVTLAPAMLSLVEAFKGLGR